MQAQWLGEREKENLLNFCLKFAHKSCKVFYYFFIFFFIFIFYFNPLKLRVERSMYTPVSALLFAKLYAMFYTFTIHTFC